MVSEPNLVPPLTVSPVVVALPAKRLPPNKVSETVRYVVEALPKEPPGTLKEPLTVRLFKVVSPVTLRVPPIVALPVKEVFPETESELRLAPDLTVKLPLISALFAKLK